MLEKFKKMFFSDISIDLGTANTLIYVSGQGIVLNEPSVVATYKKTFNGPKEIIAVGEHAKYMLGKTPVNIEAIRPLKDGVIADFYAAEKMLQYFINKVYKSNLFTPRPRVLVCVPCGSTQVERRAIKESVLSAGAKEVFLIEEPIAAAIGAGLSIDRAYGSMVIDIGGGTTEIAVISLGGLVYATSIRIGGDKLDEAIVNYVKRNYSSLIGESTAERIKKTIGSVFFNPVAETIEIRGRSLNDGLPQTINLTSHDILDAMQEQIRGILTAIHATFENIPPELAGDIAEQGIILTGGGALLKDLDKLIIEESGVNVTVAQEPLTCVVRGCGKLLEKFDKIAAGLVISD